MARYKELKFSMENLSKLMIGFVMILFITTSCNKGSSELEKNQSLELPTNETEAFDIVTKKWNIINVTEYNSIELTKNSLYIINKKLPKLSFYRDNQILTGKFEISTDGKTITLFNFGTITIKEVYENSITLYITLENGTELGDITCEENTIVATPQMTNMLCKTWELKPEIDTGYCTNEIVLPSLYWTFTKYGSIVIDRLHINRAYNCSDENFTNCDTLCFVTTMLEVWTWSLVEDGTNILIKTHGDIEMVSTNLTITNEELTMIVNGNTLNYTAKQ